MSDLSCGAGRSRRRPIRRLGLLPCGRRKLAMGVLRRVDRRERGSSPDPDTAHNSVARARAQILCAGDVVVSRASVRHARRSPGEANGRHRGEQAPRGAKSGCHVPSEVWKESATQQCLRLHAVFRRVSAIADESCGPLPLMAADPANPGSRPWWRRILPSATRTRIMAWVLLLIMAALGIVTFVTWRLLVSAVNERMDAALQAEVDEFRR